MTISTFDNLDALYERTKRDLEISRAVIDRLTDAIWEYGDHRKSCRISAGKECDCGFFEIIKDLKPASDPLDNLEKFGAGHPGVHRR